MLDYTSILKYLPITTATTADYILINSAGNNKKILLSDFISSLGLGGGGGVTLTTTGTSGAATLVSGTLNIPQYQGQLTLTTTGTSGAATLIGNTLNIPQYSFSGVTSVTGTSPIASSGGTTPAISIADAVADGTTKGAAAFNASDFNSSSGVISIDYTNGQAASASAKGFLTASDWSAFSAKQDAITLTTTGSSGAATFISNVLNVPQYTGVSINIIYSHIATF